jgi:hypothetical protein
MSATTRTVRALFSGCGRFCLGVALGAACLLAASPGRGQTVTPVPSSALSVESWMTAGSLAVQSPTSALVGQSSSGFRWDVSYFVNSGTEPSVYNAIKDAAANGGSLNYRIRFDPSLITATTQPTFIGVNSFYQTGDVANNFIQNYNTPVLGSDAFPLTGERLFDISLPIQPWTTPTVPGNGTGNAWFEPSGGWFKVGFGLNFDNATSVGFYLDNMSITAVPEPSSLAGVGLMATAAATAALRRRRKFSPAVADLQA